MDIAKRRDATLQTVNRFAGHPLVIGTHDCGKMVISHLRAMGHRPRIGQGGTWKSALGLQRFLRRHGGSGAACLDAWLPGRRIAPAMRIIGDIVELPGEPPFGCFGVCINNGRILCWLEGMEGALIAQPTQLLAAWRV